MKAWLREHELAVLLVTWLVLCAGAVGLSATASGPGMLYDEAWLAQQGRQVVEPLREGLMPPGTQKTWLLGRPFPLFALPYLGSLKSQLLIPSLALFGNDLSAVLGTTLAIALLALLATMAVARRLFDYRVGVLTGVQRQRVELVGIGVHHDGHPLWIARTNTAKYRRCLARGREIM